MSKFHVTSTVNLSGLYVLLLMSVLGTLALIYASSSAGLRGSDQYQYTADTETIRSKQPALTNLFFPAKIVRNQTVQEDTNYFSHNGPLLHIVANSNSNLNVHASWILANCLFHLITAMVIFIVARSHTSVSIATVVTALYFSSPIALWQASNVLQEQYFGALVAIGLLCYYFRTHKVTFALLPLCCFIGALSHPIFVLTGLLYGVSLVVLSPVKREYSLAITGFLALLSVLGAMAVKTQWFPTQFQPGMKEIITSAIPNISNMVYHFQAVPPDITPRLLLDKLLAAINMQFFSIRNTPFYIFTNIAGFGLLFLLYLWLIKRSISFYFIAPLVILFGAYIGMVVLQQNHARFQQIISPATFLAIAFILHRIRFNFSKPLILMVVICLLFGMNAVYAQYLREQAMLQSAAISELSAQLETIDNDAKIVSINVRKHGALAYALRPRKVLTINTNLMEQASIQSAVELFDAEFILLKGEYELINSEQLVLQSEINNRHFGDLKLYRYKRKS